MEIPVLRMLKKYGTRSEFTRKCIAEAVILLLQDTDLEHLHISDVAKKAGVSRITFYKYYTSPREALEDYLGMLIAEYVEEGKDAQGRTEYRTYQHILFSLKYFDRYRSYFLCMKQQGLYTILMDSVNEFILSIPVDHQVSPYLRYSYAGGLLNCFLQWEQGGCAEPVEDVAQMIYRLFGATDADR